MSPRPPGSSSLASTLNPAPYRVRWRVGKRRLRQRCPRSRRWTRLTSSPPRPDRATIGTRGWVYLERRAVMSQESGQQSQKAGGEVTRRPGSGSGRWADIVELQIAEARERGDFDNLRGEGQPLRIDANPHAGERALA